MENPSEKGGAEGGFGGEEEVGVVYGLCFGLLAEMVDDAIHGVLVAEERDLGAFPVEELEGLFAEVRDAPALWLLYSGGVQELWRFADPVHAEGGDLLVLIGPADHVITVAVPGQCVGAEDIGFSVVL